MQRPIQIISPSGGWRDDAALAERYGVTGFGGDRAYARGIPQEAFTRFHKRLMSDEELIQHFGNTLVQAQILYSFRGWGEEGGRLEPPQQGWFSNPPHTLPKPFRQQVFNEGTKYLSAGVCKALEDNLIKSERLQQAGLRFLHARLAEEGGFAETDIDKLRAIHEWEDLLQQALTAFLEFCREFAETHKEDPAILQNFVRAIEERESFIPEPSGGSRRRLPIIYTSIISSPVDDVPRCRRQI